MSSRDLKSILIILPWFGPWPTWMRCFLESCRWNASVDWLLVSGAPPPDDLPPNVRLISTSFADYAAKIAARLCLNIKWSEPYKLCDLKPTWAVVHAEEVAGYDYWGFGDLDVIYGDIRQFYTPDVLSHDVISAHADRIGGHFALLRNTPRINTAFQRVPFWRYYLSAAEHKGFDEKHFSRLFAPQWANGLRRRLKSPVFLGGGLFVERFSTNIAPLTWIDGSNHWPTRWFWRRGHLTSENSGAREFLYLHFSNWQSDRWTRGGPAPWKTLEKLVRLDAPRPEAFTISAQGFTPLED